MKILCISDIESKSLWDFYSKDKLKDIDLIISCGDLDSKYLEFLVSMSNKTLLYVHGNHDSHYDSNPPLGCVCIDDMIYNFKGIRICGLGGSINYHGGKYMYSEKQMLKRIRKLRFISNISGGIDIFVTHSPCLNYGDGDDYAHQGFDCFNNFLNKYKPMYMCYGHMHQQYGDFKRLLQHPSGTILVNAYQSFMIEIPDKQEKKSNLLYDLYLKHHDV